MTFVEEEMEERGPDLAAMSNPPEFASLMMACTAEATRIAHALAEVDAALGILLEAENPIGPAPPQALQSVDLLRQEAEGLAALLGLVARSGAAEAALEACGLDQVLRLQSQRDRLQHWLAGQGQT